MNQANKPFFTIITPIYKTEKYFEQCINSIKDQSFTNFECLIINDGSPGIQNFITETKPQQQAEVLFNKLVKGDSRFIYIYQKNQGACTARNNGLNIAKGEYILFVDNDDWLDENCLSKLHKSIQNGNKFPSLRLITYNNDTHKENEFPSYVRFYCKENSLKSSLVFPSHTMPSCICYNREIIEKAKIRFPLAQTGEDTIFYWNYLLSLDNPKQEFIDSKAVYHYRVHDNQGSKQGNHQVTTFYTLIDFQTKNADQILKLGMIYRILNRLYIMRFSLYITKITANNLILKFSSALFAKILTLISILISQTKKINLYDAH